MNILVIYGLFLYFGKPLLLFLVLIPRVLIKVLGQILQMAYMCVGMCVHMYMCMYSLGSNNWCLQQLLQFLLFSSCFLLLIDLLI